MNGSQIHEWTAVPWRSISGIDAAAAGMIGMHLTLIRPILCVLMQTRGLSKVMAHGMLLTPGYLTARYEKTLDALFSIPFKNAIVREPLILTISANDCWNEDPELKDFENPWPPLVEILKRGYTVSFHHDDDNDTVELMVGHTSGIEQFVV